MGISMCTICTRVNEIVDAYDENGKKIKNFYYGKDAEFPGGSSA